jgi:glycine betaine/choline ABC-type transport system substrate-binding protein
MKKKRHILFTIFAVLVTLAMILPACAPTPTEAPTEVAEVEEPPEPEEPEEAEEPAGEEMEKGLIVVGSKEFTEQIILGKIAALALQDAGYEVDDQTNLGGTAVNREALTAGEIDMYWEYTGTAWIAHLGHEDAITDPQEAFDKVKDEDAGNGLVWLAMAPFNNTYTLMMRQSDGEALGVESISDLAEYINGGGDASLCTDQEFYARPDGFKGVEALYGFQFDEDQVIMVDPGLTYKALQDGQCTTAMGFATDGRIPAFGFFNMEDDKQFFPVYNPAPVIRQEVLDANPGVADVLAPIAQALTTEVMMDLNKRVDIDEEDPEDVARDFLDTYESGYQPSAAPPMEEEMVTGLVVVGSKEFTEQIILGQIAVIALEAAGFEVDDQTNLGGTAVNREALSAGEIDMYWEYTGTAWIAHLGHEDAITDPDEAYEKVKAEDAGNGLVWLAMAPFNNTYTLMMRQSDGEELGVASISDLAEYINGGGDASLCTDQEFYARPDGFKGVEALYGFQFDEDQVIMMDPGLTYKALQDGQCTTAMGFATDGRIPAFSFFNLEDDKQFFPVYNPAPVVREEIYTQFPGIATVLDPVAKALTTEKMMELNKRVDIDEEDPFDVACDFLMTEGLVESCGE